MTNTDLVNTICHQAAPYKTGASEIFDLLLSMVKETLAAEQEVKITGFGKFEVRQ